MNIDENRICRMQSQSKSNAITLELSFHPSFINLSFHPSIIHLSFHPSIINLSILSSIHYPSYQNRKCKTRKFLQSAKLEKNIFSPSSTTYFYQKFSKNQDSLRNRKNISFSFPKKDLRLISEQDSWLRRPRSPPDTNVETPERSSSRFRILY